MRWYQLHRIGARLSPTLLNCTMHSAVLKRPPELPSLLQGFSVAVREDEGEYVARVKTLLPERNLADPLRQRCWQV